VKTRESDVSGFWRLWFFVWCLSIGVFGVVLAGGAFEATSGPVRFILTTLHGPGPVVLDPTLRFSLAVMGAVSLGWTATLAVILRQAMALGDPGRGLWQAITAGLVTWFVIDSTLSVATGFGLNVLPNLVLAGMYGIGLVGSGVLKDRT
jgi:hypothetical protein